MLLRVPRQVDHVLRWHAAAAPAAGGCAVLVDLDLAVKTRRLPRDSDAVLQRVSDDDIPGAGVDVHEQRAACGDGALQNGVRQVVIDVPMGERGVQRWAGVCAQGGFSRQGLSAGTRQEGVQV